MASRSAGIPGLAVALAAAGGYLMFVGIRDVSFIEGLREILKGQTPTGAPPTQAEIPEELAFMPVGGEIGSGLGFLGNEEGLAGAGGAGRAAAGTAGAAAVGQRIASNARKYLGVPYRWGGSTPSGWDCSGLVYHVLRESGVSVTRMQSTTYMFWKGAVTVPFSQCRAGDLVIWVGHIGIAMDNVNMINAPTFGIPTRIQRITRPNPVCRRVKG